MAHIKHTRYVHHIIETNTTSMPYTPQPQIRTKQGLTAVWAFFGTCLGLGGCGAGGSIGLHEYNPLTIT